jgi:uncharacterized repeat protein (TIGR01451 family)
LPVKGEVVKAWSAHRAMRNALAWSFLLFPAIAFAGPAFSGDLYISKTDGATNAVPGATITYTILVGNNGPDAQFGARLTDDLPSLFTSDSWTCIASIGSVCYVSSGTGDINTFLDLASGGTATFTVAAVLDAAATAGISLTNTATIEAVDSLSDPNPGNNSALDTDTVIAGSSVPEPATLALLSLGLAGLGFSRRKQ